MVQQSLVDYIRNLLQQGYDSGTIRTTLLNAGYPSSDVELGLRLAGAPVERKIQPKFLIVGFLIVLVLAAGVLLVLKLLQPAPVVLSFSMGLFSSEIPVGRDLVVNFDVLNPSGRETEGLIDIVVLGPGGRIASKTESFSVEARASVPSSVPLRDVLPGAYTVEATLSYDSKSVVQISEFEIVEAKVAAPGEALKEKAAEEAKAAQLVCPPCDDLNFCTSDACVNGECVFTRIVPCCGNGVCDPGESESSCPLDCGMAGTPDAIKARAVGLASSDLPKAMETCDTLVQRVMIDGCLNSVSDAAGSKVPCSRVVDSDIRDACLIPFAYKNDFSVCAEISNPYMKNSCNSLAEITAIQKTLPPPQ